MGFLIYFVQNSSSWSFWKTLWEMYYMNPDKRKILLHCRNQQEFLEEVKIQMKFKKIKDQKGWNGEIMNISDNFHGRGCNWVEREWRREKDRPFRKQIHMGLDADPVPNCSEDNKQSKFTETWFFGLYEKQCHCLPKIS